MPKGPRRLRAVALAAALLLPSAATGEDIGDPMRGQRLFVSKQCVTCHAVRGAGGRIGPDLGRTGSKNSFYEIAAGMWNHSVGMERKIRELRLVRPLFAGGEIGDLVAFVYFLNYFDEPGDEVIGKALFTEKRCIQCHWLGGEGGGLGPSFDLLPRGVSPLHLAEGLWNHGPAMIESMRRQGLEVPQFRGEEIIDLFAYIRSQGQGRVAREFDSAGDPDRGQSLFESKGCARCHDVFGGEGSIGPDLGKGELRGSVTQIAGRMWNHWPAMAEAMAFLEMPSPSFGRGELADLLAFIFISRYGGERGVAARGETIYRERGCSLCHGVEGEGTLGPPLSQVTPGRGREEIFTAMWNHAPEMWTLMDEHQLRWPRFEAVELADLVAFLAESWSGED